MRASRRLRTGLGLALFLGLLPLGGGARAEPASVVVGAERTDLRLRGGSRLSYLHWPAPGRPAMLLIHGKGGYATGFQDLADRWHGRYDLYAIDLRGRGYSDWAGNGDYSVEATLSDLDQFAAALGLRRLGLYGESFGAVVALAYAARHPETVPFLILDDGGPIRLPDGTAPAPNPGQIALAGVPQPRPTPLHFADWAAAGLWQAAHCRSHCTRAQLESQFVRTADGVVERTDTQGLWKSPQGPLFEDQWPAVDQLRMPTLLIRAERGLVPRPIAEAMVTRNARIRFLSVPGATHTVHGSMPGAAYIAADQFLQSLGAADH